LPFISLAIKPQVLPCLDKLRLVHITVSSTVACHIIWMITTY